MQLSQLGPRICILGPTNSGKSTLAAAIGRKLELPVIHLDRLYHVPGSDWEVRPQQEFIALHDAAIAVHAWVMDGNYRICMPQRFQRATGLILLDAPPPVRLWRFLRRTFSRGARAGALEGQRDSLKWPMLYHVAITSARKQKGLEAIFDSVDLPKVKIASRKAMRECWRSWDLGR